MRVMPQHVATPYMPRTPLMAQQMRMAMQQQQQQQQQYQNRIIHQMLENMKTPVDVNNQALHTVAAKPNRKVIFK